ncbi:MAG: preprotein translocase subunit SecE [Acidobacteria bacterium]|nr:preprotein translocase subunit SecE [Acidobacteriota bacterium]
MEERNFFEKAKQWPQDVKSYVQDLRLEMKRVTWPSRKQVQGTTGVVILAVFAFAAYFAAVDALLSRSIVKLYNVMTK